MGNSRSAMVGKPPERSRQSRSRSSGSAVTAHFDVRQNKARDTSHCEAKTVHSAAQIRVQVTALSYVKKCVVIFENK